MVRNNVSDGGRRAWNSIGWTGPEISTAPFQCTGSVEKTGARETDRGYLSTARGTHASAQKYERGQGIGIPA